MQERQRSVLHEVVVRTVTRTILDTLKRNRGNVRRTARELRMPYRTLNSRIRALGLRDDVEYFRRARRVVDARAR